MLPAKRSSTSRNAGSTGNRMSPTWNPYSGRETLIARVTTSEADPLSVSHSNSGDLYYPGLSVSGHAGCSALPLAWPGGSINSEHAAEYPGTHVCSCYSYCMISPNRGDFTGFCVQSPPLDTFRFIAISVDFTFREYLTSRVGDAACAIVGCHADHELAGSRPS